MSSLRPVGKRQRNLTANAYDTDPLQGIRDVPRARHPYDGPRRVAYALVFVGCHSDD